MYSLTKLPFSFEDLEPFIDTHTIGLHYLKHQASYLSSLNKILKKYDFNYEIEDLYNHLDKINSDDLNDVIFFLGGVVNHNIYWESINPYNKELPQGKLLEKFNSKYKDIDNFWEEVKKLVVNLKGSGYVFLVKTKNNGIDLIATSNQDSPLLYGFIPLFTIDLWEHAYYINYENDKLKYLENFKTIANFKYANNIFNK